MVKTSSRPPIQQSDQQSGQQIEEDIDSIHFLDEPARDRINEEYETSLESPELDDLDDIEFDDNDALDAFEQSATSGISPLLDNAPDRAYVLLYELLEPLEVIVDPAVDPAALLPDTGTLLLRAEAEQVCVYRNDGSVPLIGTLSADSAATIFDEYSHLLDVNAEAAEIVFMRGQTPELQIYGNHPQSFSDRLDTLSAEDAVVEELSNAITEVVDDLSKLHNPSLDRAQRAAIAEEIKDEEIVIEQSENELRTENFYIDLDDIDDIEPQKIEISEPVQTDTRIRQEPISYIDLDDDIEQTEVEEEIAEVGFESLEAAEEEHEPENKLADLIERPSYEVMTIAQQHVALAQSHFVDTTAEQRAFAVFNYALENSQTDWLQYNGAIAFRSGSDGQDTAIVDMKTGQTVLYHDAEPGRLRGTLPEGLNYDHEFEQLIVLPTMIKVLNRAVAEPPELLSPGQSRVRSGMEQQLHRLQAMQQPVAFAFNEGTVKSAVAAEHTKRSQAVAQQRQGEMAITVAAFELVEASTKKGSAVDRLDSGNLAIGRTKDGSIYLVHRALSKDDRGALHYNPNYATDKNSGVVIARRDGPTGRVDARIAEANQVLPPSMQIDFTQRFNYVQQHRDALLQAAQQPSQRRSKPKLKSRDIER